MYDIIEELKDGIDDFHKAVNYEFYIGVNEGYQTSELYRVKNEDLFYMIDNGSPRNGIPPFNICRRFKDWFNSNIAQDLEERLYAITIYQEYDPQEVQRLYESYIPEILDWYKNEIRKLTVLDFNMNSFANEIFVKIIYKDI